MEWNDEGIVLAVRRYGENSHIITVFSQNNGRYSGLVRGSKNRTEVFQLGNLVTVYWRSRNENSLGNFKLEIIESFSAKLLNDPLRLSSLCSACALIEKTLPDREGYQELYRCFKTMLANLLGSSWAEDYVRWEVFLLSTLGYGLNLSCCVVTGENDNLIYVSPKSGCAVSRQAGEEYENRLLPLPSFLVKNEGNGIATQEIAKGLKLTEYFLKRHIFNNDSFKIPFARNRLAGFFNSDVA